MNTETDTIDASYYYDAFGNILESTGSVSNNIKYAGYQYDEETGYYYLNARMYDPITARFLQEDTYSGDPNDPLSLNLYTYGRNNPLIYIDPTGHSAALAHEIMMREAKRIADAGGTPCKSLLSDIESAKKEMDKVSNTIRSQKRINEINREIKVRGTYAYELFNNYREWRGNKDFGQGCMDTIDVQASIIEDLVYERNFLLLDNPSLVNKEFEGKFDLSPWKGQPGTLEQKWTDIKNDFIDRDEKKLNSAADYLNWTTAGWYGNVNGSFNRLLFETNENNVLSFERIMDFCNVYFSVGFVGKVGSQALNELIYGTTPVLNGGGGPSPAQAVKILNGETAGKTGVIEQHHLLPQQFKPQFGKAGLDIEDYKIPMDKADHRLKPSGLHTGDTSWNRLWTNFFENNPNATQPDILNQLDKMKEAFGLK